MQYTAELPRLAANSASKPGIGSSSNPLIGATMNPFSPFFNRSASVETGKRWKRPKLQKLNLIAQLQNQQTWQLSSRCFLSLFSQSRIKNLKFVTIFASERLWWKGLSFIDVDYLSMPKYYRKNGMRLCVWVFESVYLRECVGVCVCECQSECESECVSTRWFLGWSLKLSTSSLWSAQVSPQ